MTRLFGTDGVRGLANGPVINADKALRLSEAAARVFGRTITGGGERMTAVVGRDPRASGEFLSAAVIAGLASSGVDVYDVGVLPTPAVAFLTADLGANFGVMLSASHNAMPDNGIKFFALGGHKLPDEVEDRIEEAMDATPTARPVPPSDASARSPKVLRATPIGCSRRCRTRSTGCMSSSMPPTVRPARSARMRSAAQVRRSPSSAPSPTVSTSTTATAPPTWTSSRRPS